MISEKAPAKINLYLHVTGKRANGFHELDSLTVFARDEAACDRIEMREAERLRLSITGPEAGALQNEPPEKNLAVKALVKLGALLSRKPDFDVTLLKTLPVASGIGGGSADAAAALRGAARLWNLDPRDPALEEAAKSIGSDILACLASAPCYMGGTGDEIVSAEIPSGVTLLLANPHIPLPTHTVFAARATMAGGAFSEPARFITAPPDAASFAEALSARRNDLEVPASKLCDAIPDVLDTLREQPGCLLARLSGSGATCFGIFESRAAAEKAKGLIAREIREWWLAVTEI